MVSQSLPAVVKLCRQRRRLYYLQFYTDAGYDASRAPRGKLAEVRAPSQVTSGASVAYFSDLFVLGELLHQLGICPIVKRIWTPSWVLFSVGWCFLFMAVLYVIVDWAKLKKWAFPLIVMNSIAAYVIAHLIGDFTLGNIRTHFG